MPEENVAPRRVPPRIAIGAAVALVLLVFVAVSAAGSFPAVCGSCHAMRPFGDSLAKSSHSGVSCYACHLDDGPTSWPGMKARELFVMYPTAAVGRGVSGPGDRITSERCLACHDNIMDKTIESEGTRIRHASCADAQECDTCHSATAHGETTRWVRQPVMDDCVSCHLERSATVECDTCHVEKSTAQRLAAGPWQVTHGANWRQTHGMGDIAVCEVCHPRTKCVSCHGIPLPHPVDFGRTHGTDAQAPTASCAQCHDRGTFCDTCHGTPMPHAADFLPGHSKIAKDRTDPACLKCHIGQDCADCHLRHTHPGNTQGTLGAGTP